MLVRRGRPPEQLEGKADARVDLFTFGCVLYETLTGRRAFTGETGASVMLGILSSQPPYVSSLLSEAPPALDRLVERCLQKDPDGRPESARDAEDLRSILGDSAASTVTAPSDPPRSVVRLALAFSAIVVAVVARELARESIRRRSGFLARPAHRPSNSFSPL